jgi:Ca-activated chloride channel homolog
MPSAWTGQSALVEGVAMSRLFSVIGVISLVAVLASVARTQPTVSKPLYVRGVVMDQNGAPLPGATVDLIGAPPIVPRRAVTDARGEFVFAGVPPGAYEVQATLAGFVPTSERLRIETRDVSLRVVLLLAATKEQVAVGQQSADASKRAAMRVGPGVVGGMVGGRPAAAPVPFPRWNPNFNTEAYAHIESNGFRRVDQFPLSTFSIDVDTASYANTRRFITDGRLPPPDAVRIEELVNYFGFDYALPKDGSPFSVTTEVAACPWNGSHQLALVALQGRKIDSKDVPPHNLVFLIDVSGSIMPPDKLPLLRTSMRMLVDQLRPIDRVAIVVYAGTSGLVLQSTPGHQKERIHEAIARLEAGGSTNGGEGIRLAYAIAQDHVVKGGVNRVILATDGDFNVGVTSEGELVRLIEEKRRGGVFLSVLGFGTGNLNDAALEKLADKGNGNYAYIDSLHEARKVLVNEAGGMLVTIAKDVKIQVEFNPRHVGAYRLIGYENRLLKDEDFNDDRKDAGEIGSGHSVTALYEIVPKGREGDVPMVDALKYQRPRPVAGGHGDELLTIKVRYKAPDGDTSRLIEAPVAAKMTGLGPNVGFAAAVAGFGIVLREDEHRGSATFEQVRDLARRFRGDDPHGYRAEFIRLVDLARSLSAMGEPAKETAAATR